MHRQRVSEMSADQPTNSPGPEADRQQTLADLHELVDALDRRVPHPDRAGERAIATDSAELKKDAEERIAQLEDPPRTLTEVRRGSVERAYTDRAFRSCFPDAASTSPLRGRRPFTKAPTLGVVRGHGRCRCAGSVVQREWVIHVRPIETIDVSRPPAATGTAKAAAVVGDLALAVLLALILPLGLVVLFSSLAGLVRVALALAGLL